MIDAVRPAVRGDIVAIIELEVMARHLMASQRGGPAHLAESPPVDAWAGAVADGLVWVSEIDGVVLGYLQLQVSSRIAAVRQVFVHPDARELGFGDLMLEAAIDAARSRSCTHIEGVALPGDRDTKNLYERAGVTARKIVVSKTL